MFYMRAMVNNTVIYSGFLLHEKNDLAKIKIGNKYVTWYLFIYFTILAFYIHKYAYVSHGIMNILNMYIKFIEKIRITERSTK